MSSAVGSSVSFELAARQSSHTLRPAAAAAADLLMLQGAMTHLNLWCLLPASRDIVC